MQAIPVSKLQRILARAACGAVMLGCVLASAAAQGNGSPASAGGSIQLQPYTAPDNSASAGVPAGWKVTKGGQTVIQMTGPQGESISLGNTVIARNAPFQPGQRATGGTDLSMPYSASLAQKLTMIFEQGAAVSGKPAPQVTFTSTTPIPLPPSLGQCGRFVAGITNPAGPMKIMGAICSLPLDSGGIYKNIMLLAQAPEAVAAQDSPIASAVFSSYQIPAAMLQRKLAPFTQPPIVIPSPGGAMPIPGMDDTGAECFDLGVIRELPPSRLPQKCGGRLPN
jgi:hypothetical protein